MATLVKADLHTHTRASDGELAPAELVQRAAWQGLSVLAITDHDTLAGYDAAFPLARAEGLDLVCGIELSTKLNGRSVHLLGYFFDTGRIGPFRVLMKRPDGVGQRLALDQPHGIGRLPLVVGDQAVDGHHAGMLELGGDLSLQEETPAAVGIAGVARLDLLESDGALQLFILNLVGLGAGPLAVGWLNDLFAVRFGPEAVRWSLCVVAGIGATGSLFLLRASRSLPHDLIVREG